VKYPDGTPAWLKIAVESLEEDAQRAILHDEPAKACGFNAAVIHLKSAITEAAESEEQKRMRQLHELTWGPDGKPAS
jgi:hypothetical protein